MSPERPIPPSGGRKRRKTTPTPRLDGERKGERNSHFSFGLALDVRKNDCFVEPDITGPGTFCSLVAKVASLPTRLRNVVAGIVEVAAGIDVLEVVWHRVRPGASSIQISRGRSTEVHSRRVQSGRAASGDQNRTARSAALRPSSISATKLAPYWISTSQSLGPLQLVPEGQGFLALDQDGSVILF